MPIILRSLTRKPKPPVPPAADPRFARVMQQLGQKAAKVKQHPAPAKKAEEAAKAAKGPPNEKAAGAKGKQVDKIKDAKTKKPEPASFLSLLRAEIEKAMPKTLDDTTKFMKGGDAPALKGGLKGNVAQQKQEATGDTAQSAKQTPSTAGVPGKESQAIPDEAAPPRPDVPAGDAMPAPKPDSEVSVQDSKHDTEAAMADAEVTEAQCKKANDSRFSAVLESKGQVAKQADEAPGKYRSAEKGVLNTAAAGARGAARAGAGAMLNVKGRSKQSVLTRQQAAKQKDEAERKKVADNVEAIYNKTKAQVEAKLSALDEEVNSIFDSGTDAALAAMKAYVEARIDAYKDDRYSGVIGKGRWIRDQFKGLPEEANRFYVEGRNLFARLMDAVIVRVANLVEQRLREAKALVAAGQAEIKTYVESLPKNLKSVGQSAQKEVADRFKELERGIEEKKGQLAQQLAQKYKEAFDKADKALKEIQDSNKGLVQKFVEKLGEIIKIIREFKDKLMAALRKGWSVIKGILADPIGFLGNLIAALKAGFNQFKANIKTWLIKGLIGWLFGALAEAGVTPPADFSLPSILKLVLQILGITYERMREKAVKLLGPTAVAVVEKLVEYVKTLMTGGPAALWAQVSGDLSDLKERVLGDIREMIITEVIKAAVMKIVSMFNPVGAFVQAVLAIYNTVMFVIEQASRIAALVSSVIDSVAAIAGGAVGAAANRIEQALGAAIPIVIGFLARLVGVGGLPKKATAVVKKVQTAVDKAIDKLLGKAIAMVKKMAGKLGIKERTPEEKQRDLERAGSELRPKVKALMGKGVPLPLLKARLAVWRVQYKLTTLQMEGKELVATINPKLKLAEGWSFDEADVFRVVDKIAGDLVAEASAEAKTAPTPPVVTLPGGKQQEQIDLTQRSAVGAGVTAVTRGRQNVTVGKTESGAPVAFEHGPEQRPYGPPWFYGIGGGGGAKGQRYDDIAAKLAGKPVGDWLKMLAKRQPLPKEAEPHAGDLAELYGLLMAKEPSHGQGAQRRDLVYSMMAIDVMSGPEGRAIEKTVGKEGIHPSTFGKAQTGAKLVTEEMTGAKGGGRAKRGQAAPREERRRRERETLLAWFARHKADLPVLPQKPTLADVEAFIRGKLKEIFRR